MRWSITISTENSFPLAARKKRRVQYSYCCKHSLLIKNLYYNILLFKILIECSLNAWWNTQIISIHFKLRVNQWHNWETQFLPSPMPSMGGGYLLSGKYKYISSNEWINVFIFVVYIHFIKLKKYGT